MFKFDTKKYQDFAVTISAANKGDVFPTNARRPANVGSHETSGPHEYIMFYLTGSFERIGSDGAKVLKKSGDIGDATTPYGPITFRALEDGSSHACLKPVTHDGGVANWKHEAVRIAAGSERLFQAGDTTENFYVGVGSVVVNGKTIPAGHMIRLGAGKSVEIEAPGNVLLLHLWLEPSVS